MSWILSFLRSTRAGATAITAVAVTIMTVAGIGFVIDHVWLVSQRDLLKAAADSASIAATQRLGELPAGQQEAEVAAELQAVAERYVRFILEGNLGPVLRRQQTSRSRSTSIDHWASSEWT